MTGSTNDTSAYADVSDEIRRAVTYSERKKAVDDVTVRYSTRNGHDAIYIDTVGRIVPNPLVQKVNLDLLKVKRIQAEEVLGESVVKARFEVKPSERQ